MTSTSHFSFLLTAVQIVICRPSCLMLGWTNCIINYEEYRGEISLWSSSCCCWNIVVVAIFVAPLPLGIVLILKWIIWEVFEYWEFENRWKKSFYLPWIALDEVGIHSWGSHSSGLVQRMSHAARSVGLLPWYTRHHHLVKASTVALLSYCWDFAAVYTCWSWEFVWFKRIRLSAVLTCRCGQRLIPTSRHRFLRAVTPTPSSLAASSIVELV